MAYAAAVPEARFLLVATRRSGWVENPPANVSTAWLRSYRITEHIAEREVGVGALGTAAHQVGGRVIGPAQLSTLDPQLDA